MNKKCLWTELVPSVPKLLQNLLMPLFLMGCFPVDFQEVKRPLRTKSVKRPIKVGKRPINEGKLYLYHGSGNDYTINSPTIIDV